MIWLLRHGRTEANARGLLLGRADPALDDVGRDQALRAAKALMDVGATRVITSPLQRCRETAALVGETLGVPVVFDDRWVEMDYGELDGTPVASVPPETWAAWMADVGWTPPGGESIAALGERVRAACDELLSSAAEDDGDVVVVSHVSPIKAAVAWALGVGDEVAWRLFLAPASISTISTARGRPSLHAFNGVSHLTRS
ncbi:MAG TPA: histidine phosphatase family protein [Acidimicrobiales bacterium]|nr:histidine phosphatase family protein [Acidimicrobiales bacterium]